MAKPNLNPSISQVKCNFTWREPVRPFISSTFVDFEEERDHLVRRIFPQLNSLCHSRGTFFAPVDLRWGINEEQSQSGHVISLCLDYINQCTPFFICLLGERYGSHRPNNSPPLPTSYKDLPDDAHWLDGNFLRAADNGHKWVLQEACQKASVTELEIIQAAFLNDSKYCRFYFRDVRHIEQRFTDLSGNEREEKIKPYLAEDVECELKVKELKNGIVARGLPVRFYFTAEELGEKVLQDWKSIINEVYPPLQSFLSNVDSELFQEWAAHEAYAETRRRVFIKTDNIKELWEKLHQHGESAMEEDRTDEEGMSLTGYRRKQSITDSKSIFAVVGDRGCGKSAILANWVKSFSTLNPNTKVISHFVGSSSLSADITSFLRRATYELRGEFAGTETQSSPDTEDLSDFHRICEAFIAAISLAPCVLVLDGIDELGPTLGLDIHQVKQLPWLPVKLPNQCKLVISTIRSDLTYKCLCQREDAILNVVPLFDSTKDKGQVITDMLAVHCKHLNQDQVAMVVESKLSDHPLYLSILANELRVGGTYRNLGHLLKQYVKADSFIDLWRCVIDRWTKDYGWDLDGRSSVSSNSQLDSLSGWVADMLKLIACSRQGLNETELVDILGMMGYTGSLKVTAFDFAMLRSATFDALFERPGGLMNFFHQHLREAVEFSLLGVIGGTGIDTPSSSVINFLPSSGENQVKRQCHEMLASYFYNQPPSLRRTEELTYHLEKCGDLGKLFEIVTDPEVFLMMCSDGSHRISLRLDLVRYWQCLVKAGYDPAAAYVDMVMTLSSKEEEDNEEHQELLITKDTADELLTPPPPTCTGEDADAKKEKKFSKEVSSKLSAIEEKNDSHNEQLHQSSDHLVEESNSKTDLPPKVPSADIGIKNGVMPADNEDDDSDEYFDAPEGDDSDEEWFYYEHQPEERCKLAVLGMHAGKFLAEKACFKEAEQLLTLAVEFMMKKFPLSTPEHVLLVQIQGSLADLHYYQLKTVIALKCYKKALDTLENIAICEKDFLYKQVMEAKGRLLNRIGLMRGRVNLLCKGEGILLDARDCMRRANSITGLATTQFNLGQLKIWKKDFEAGEECLRDALHTRERWNGKSHPLVAEVLDELAGVLCNPNNFQRCDTILSEAYYRRALKIREQSFGGDHLLVATSLFHLGKLLKSTRNLQCKNEAVTLFQRSLDIRTTKLGAEHQLTHGVCHNLKQVQTQLKVGDYDYAPVKKLDKRTKQNPRSNLTWHEHDLDKFDKHPRTRSAKSKKFSKGNKSYKVGAAGEKISHGATSSYGPHTMIDADQFPRLRAQSAPLSYEALDIAVQSELDVSSQSIPGGISDNGHESSRYNFGRSSPGTKSGRGIENRSKSDMSWRRTVSHSASTQITAVSQFPESRPSTSFSRRSHSSGHFRPSSQVSYVIHDDQCNIPGQFDLHPSNTRAIRSPHSHIHHLLGDPPCPRDLESKPVHKAAWYHQPNRYPKNAYDGYPPRRHQVRPGNKYSSSTM